jgi:probable O-glycosylation ligase (exosortase A-associated)
MFVSQFVAYFAVFVACTWTVRNPVVGVYAYYFLALCRPHDMYWWSLGDMRLSFYVAITVCGIWLLKWVQKEHDGPGKSPVNVLMLSFFLLKFASATYAVDQAAAWDHIDKVWKMFLFYYVAVSLVDTRERFRWMVIVMAVSMGWLGLWGNWQWYVEGIGGGITGELAGPGWPVGATLTDRNLYGMVLAMGIPICGFIFMTEQHLWLRWAGLACIPFLANAAMLTFGRGTFLGMVICSAWSVFRLRRGWLVVGSALVLALLLTTLAGQEVRNRLGTIDSYEQDKSSMSRLQAWSAGWEMMKEFPFLGVGPAQYGNYSSRYDPTLSAGMVAHNEFVQTAAETGLPSAVVLIAIIGLTFYNLHKVRKATWAQPETHWAYYYAAMIESSLVGFIVCAMFLSLPYFELLYLLAALAVCLRHMVEGAVQAVAMPPQPVAFWTPLHVLSPPPRKVTRDSF